MVSLNCEPLEEEYLTLEQAERYLKTRTNEHIVSISNFNSLTSSNNASSNSTIVGVPKTDNISWVICCGTFPALIIGATTSSKVCLSGEPATVCFPFQCTWENILKSSINAVLKLPNKLPKYSSKVPTFEPSGNLVLDIGCPNDNPAARPQGII